MSMYVDAYLASQHRRSYLEGGWRSPGHLEWSPRRGMRPARAGERSERPPAAAAATLAGDPYSIVAAYRPARQAEEGVPEPQPRLQEPEPEPEPEALDDDAWLTGIMAEFGDDQ